MSMQVYLDERASIANIEIRHIHNAIFGMDPIVIPCSDDDRSLQLCIIQTHDTYFVEATCKQKALKLTIECNKKKTMKQNVAHVFLKAMYQINSENMLPWGILTGIRPMKLYRKLVTLYGSIDEANQDLLEFYLLSKHKIKLLQQIFEVQEPLLQSYTMNELVSLYIGIPYCPSRCSYCTFPAYVTSDVKEQNSFFRTVLKELEWTMIWLEEQRLTVAAIYIGGGTPSTLNAEQMKKLFQCIAKYINIDTIEITFEAGRPDTITEEKLRILKDYAVKRISINPQTFHDSTLQSIGRNHTVEDIFKVYQFSKECNFDQINMDLILGLPDETVEDFQNTLGIMGMLSPDAVTIHTLALKSKSKLKQQMAISDFKKNQIKEMVTNSQKWATENGYVPYYLYRQKNIAGNFENVGYAKDGKHSIYNMFIMEEVMSIIGIGCGAVSKLIDGKTGKLERVANPVDPIYYVKNIEGVIQNKRKHLPNILTKI